MEDAAPLIMTALIERTALARFDALRREHFPPERNLLTAHLTMFHHLPGTRASDLLEETKDAARHEQPMRARAARMQFMGRGCSILIECAELCDLRDRLRSLWEPWLIPQDQQRWRPHVTVQNKAEPKAARALYDRLDRSFSPWMFQIDGVTLWWYRNGPWEKLRDVRFR
jgi:2'-5' RNA ligase|tara:strand:- start:15801 stop:16310 length:510 start_codon:yes stop_codon:yes gene_type:complete